MQGFRVNIATDDDLTGIRFKLYDNDDLVLDDIAALDFNYLVPDGYAGEHVLSLAYYKETIPGVESTKQEFFRENFTLPTLNLTVTVTVIAETF